MAMKISEDLLDALGQVEGESARAKEALIEYAKMERRSLAELCKRYARKENPPTRRITTLKQWSSQYQWQDRVGKFDSAKAVYEFEEWNQRKKDLNEMAWEQALWIRKNAFTRIKKIKNDSEDKIAILNYSRLIKSLSEMDSMQRLAVNEPTSIIGIEDPEELDRFINEQLERPAPSNQTEVSSAP